MTNHIRRPHDKSLQPHTVETLMLSLASALSIVACGHHVESFGSAELTGLESFAPNYSIASPSLGEDGGVILLISLNQVDGELPRSCEGTPMIQDGEDGSFFARGYALKIGFPVGPGPDGGFDIPSGSYPVPDGTLVPEWWENYSGPGPWIWLEYANSNGTVATPATATGGVITITGTGAQISGTFSAALESAWSLNGVMSGTFDVPYCP